MKVILLKDVSGVGKKYDVKDVSAGYAQNFLLPRKVALVATGPEVRRIESEKKKMDLEAKIQDELLEKNIESLKGLKVAIQAKASETGHLFAGIHRKQIIEAIKKQTGIQILEDNIELEGTIKTTGLHKIPIKFRNKKVEFELVVEG